MEAIFEVLLELFGELLIQLIAQALGLVGEHALQPYRNSTPRSPTASILSHLAIGAALGGLSLIVWRDSLIHGDLARVAYLLYAEEMRHDPSTPDWPPTASSSTRS